VKIADAAPFAAAWECLYSSSKNDGHGDFPNLAFEAKTRFHIGLTWRIALTSSDTALNLGKGQGVPISWLQRQEISPGMDPKKSLDGYVNLQPVWKPLLVFAKTRQITLGAAQRGTFQRVF